MHRISKRRAKLCQILKKSDPFKSSNSTCAGGGFGLGQSIHNNISSQKVEAKNISQRISYSGDIDLMAVSQPAKPVTATGQICQTFINRFNNDIVLDSKTGQFVINQKLLRVNATNIELGTLNTLVAQSNSQLKQIVQKSPKSHTVQVGNSVVVANSITDAQRASQQNDLTTTSSYHYGSTYLHVYWYGFRIGLNRSDVQLAVGAGLVIAGVYVPVRAAQAALGVLGLTVGRFIPGGVVFNSSPQFAPLMGSRAVVWGTMAMKINGYKIIMTSMVVVAVILQIFFHLNPIASIIIKVLLGVVIFSAISRIILDNKNKDK